MNLYIKNIKDIYKNKKVLITGHTGFKGSWLSLWLLELGAKVIGYSLEPPTETNLFESINLKNRITHVFGDIRDEDCLLSVFEKHHPEFVFHLAAQSLVKRSYTEPKLTYETNIMGTINILESIRKTNSVRACVIVTSDKCYDNKEWVYGYRETDPMGGYDPYSSSKGCAELIVAAYRNSFFNPEDYSKSHRVVLSSARAGNVIGGGDWAEDRLIPDCIRTLSKKQEITIRASRATRPWQYILEPLFGYLLLAALMYEYGAKYSDSWNFGPDDEKIITVEELVKLAIRYWGKGSYKLDNLQHPHEASLLKLDTSKARTLLGWKPIYNINKTIKRTINWYKNFYNDMKKDELYKFTVGEIWKYVNCLIKEDCRNHEEG